MKELKNILLEKLVLTKNTKVYTYKYFPKSYIQLSKYVYDKYDKAIKDYNNKDKILDCTDICINSLKDISEIFSFMSNIKIIDISTWQFDNIEDVSGMFKGCINLEKIIFNPNINYNNIQNANEMFKGCQQLTSINIGKSLFNKDCSINMMFAGTPSNLGKTFVKQ